MINSNLVNSKFKVSQFLIKHDKSDLIISLAEKFFTIQINGVIQQLTILNLQIFPKIFGSVLKLTKLR